MHDKLIAMGTVAVLAMVAGGAHAQSEPGAAGATPTPHPEPAQAAAPAGEQDVSEIVVTGTRQASTTVADSMSPIRALSPETLQHSGKLGLEEILADVLPSFNLPSQAGGNLSNIVRVAQLRGLNPDQTLVLVNGKRRHAGPIVNVSGTVGIGAQPVDLNLIPPGAIARVEVLTDGAAAQYGSDAIAGVINIILKDSDHGGSFTSQGGQYFDGDGSNEAADLNAGFKLGSDGFINVTGSALNQRSTDRDLNATITPLYYPGDPRNSLPDGKRQFGYGIPPQFIIQGEYNAEKPIAAGFTAYSFGTYAYQSAEQYIGYRAPSNVNNVVSIYPNGFQPKDAVHQDDYQFTVGLKNDNLYGGWAADGSVSWGYDKTNVYLFDSVSPTYGNASPKNFYIGQLDSGLLTGNLDFRRPFNIHLYAPLNVAIGGEYKMDTFQIRAGQVESYARGPFPVLTGPSTGLFTDIPGSQAVSGFTPLDASFHHRQSFAGYADLETTILKGWDVGLAGRYESYSDFGDNASGKLSTRYQVLPWVALRGTVSNGFRAPSLGQEYYSTSSTSQFKGVDYKIALVPASSVAASILGGKPLKAEDSFNLSGGFVLTPIHNFTFTVDAYQIDIDDRIVLSSNIGLLPSGALNPTVAALLAAQGIQGVNVGRYFLNGANTRTKGVDAVATYVVHVGPGRLNLTAAFNEGDSHIRSLTNQASAPIYGTVVFNQVAQDQVTRSTPHNKTVLSGDYEIGRFSIFLRESRFGHYIAPSTVTGGYSYASPAYTTDLELGYRMRQNLILSIGAQNLFNQYPSHANPLNFATATFNGANYYNAQSPFGISGGDYYARLKYSW